MKKHCKASILILMALFVNQGIAVTEASTFQDPLMQNGKLRAREQGRHKNGTWNLKVEKFPGGDLNLPLELVEIKDCYQSIGHMKDGDFIWITRAVHSLSFPFSFGGEVYDFESEKKDEEHYEGKIENVETKAKYFAQLTFIDATQQFILQPMSVHFNGTPTTVNTGKDVLMIRDPNIEKARGAVITHPKNNRTMFCYTAGMYYAGLYLDSTGNATFYVPYVGFDIQKYEAFLPSEGKVLRYENPLRFSIYSLGKDKAMSLEMIAKQ